MSLQLWLALLAAVIPAATTRRFRRIVPLPIRCFAALTLCCSALPACTSTPPRQPQAFSPAGHWRLLSIEGRPIPRANNPGVAGVSPAPPTLTIHEGGAVRGHTGVNHLSATADPARWPAGGFALTEIAHIEMAAPPEAMALERRYLDALRRVDAYLPGTRTLELLDGREAAAADWPRDREFRTGVLQT